MNVQTLFTATAGFKTARQLDGLAAGNRFGRPHGHSFLVGVRAAFPEGWAQFPGGEVLRLRAEVERAVAALDYRLPNEQLQLPTDANLARWLQHSLQVPGAGRRHARPSGPGPCLAALCVPVGEGRQAGRAAVFCRFAGCNLWSGREDDRASAVRPFCDTDFIGTDGPGGGKFATADLLASEVRSHWPPGSGGKPLLADVVKTAIAGYS